MNIDDLKKEALDNKIPIMQDYGIDFLLEFIKKNKIKRILEIGTAVGYSAIKMAALNDFIEVVSIERDEVRYLKATENVKLVGLEDRIDLIFGDALDVEISGIFDLIFIDAAKGKNIEFFEKFEHNLSDDGYIVTDNLKFHGYVDMEISNIQSRNIRGLVRKIRKYIDFLQNNEHYKTKFLDIGDGISISSKIK